MKTSVLQPATILVPVLLSHLLQSGLLLASPCQALNFVATGPFGAGIIPFSVAMGDFNRDGKPDLAVANKFSADVSVLLGKGDGTFQAAVNYPAGSGSSSVSAADFNADGKLDLVVANASRNNVSVLLGQGDGAFLTASNYATGGVPSSVAVGDFNSDNRPDLAIANRATANVSVLLGNGNGTFQTALNFGAGVDPLSLAVGDFNGDGKLDLVVGNSALFEDPPSLSVLLGNGNGTFQAATNYAAGISPRSVAVGDLNGDGKPDLAVANYGAFTDGQFTNSSVSVLLGNGNGTFRTAVHYSAGAGPVSVVVCELNLDGKPDLAVANNRSGTVSVLSGNGDGTFQAADNSAVGATPVSLAVGNFNGDNRPDLAVVKDGGVLALLNAPGDNTPPQIDCPANITVNATPGTCTSNVTFSLTTTDDCAVTNILSMPASGFAFPIGTTTVTSTAQDSGGNSSQCTFTVTVEDKQLPVLIGLPSPSFSVQCRADVPAAPKVTANDNCHGNVPVTFTASESGDPCHRVISRTWSALDASGNLATFTQTITVHDDTAPSLTNGTIASTYATVTDAEAAAIEATGANDNCSVVTKTAATVGECPAVITVTVSDECGNRVTASYGSCISADIGLTIVRNDGNVTLSWPFPSVGFVLESTTSLSPSNWESVAEVPTSDIGCWNVSVPLDQSRRYFRLRKP